MRILVQKLWNTAKMNMEKEQKLEGQGKGTQQAKTFPITKLPVELQLQILSYVLAHDKPIIVSGFTSTCSFALPAPSPPSSAITKSTHPTSAKSWIHLPFSIMLTSKHMHNLSQSILFAPSTNTFTFTTPPSRQWSYGRDWFWAFTFMVDHMKGTAAAMKNMSRVLFKCDGSMDYSLVGTAIDNLPNMTMLTVDFKDFWGSPSAKLEEEGRRDSGLGGFGGHAVLSDRNQSRTLVYHAVEGIGEVVCQMEQDESPTMTVMAANLMVEDDHAKYLEVGAGKETLVAMVWRNVVLVGTEGRFLKELKFSGLKMGKGNWDEVVAYGERVAGRKGEVEVEQEDGSLEGVLVMAGM